MNNSNVPVVKAVVPKDIQDSRSLPDWYETQMALPPFLIVSDMRDGSSCFGLQRTCFLWVSLTKPPQRMKRDMLALKLAVHTRNRYLSCLLCDSFSNLTLNSPNCTRPCINHT